MYRYVTLNGESAHCKDSTHTGQYVKVKCGYNYCPEWGSNCLSRDSRDLDSTRQRRFIFVFIFFLSFVFPSSFLHFLVYFSLKNLFIDYVLVR